MAIADLSYAKNKQNKEPVVMALDVRGWSVGWATLTSKGELGYGLLRAREHVGGHPVPASHRIASIFKHLIAAASRGNVTLVAVNHRENPGPAWSVSPLLALVVGAQYGEARDWVEHMPIASPKELRSWATVFTGKPVADEVVATAVGLAYVLTRGHAVEQASLREVEELTE